MPSQNSNIYNKKIYNENRPESYRSAGIILDIFKEYYMPQSVFDFGCGVGTWLRAWQDLGVERIYGIDANVMEEEDLLIPREKIGIVDFEKDSPKIGKYDLAMSLECLEHISEARAICAVDLLTNAADIILFSAAVPHQTGTNHINCQSLSYWTSIFASKGYKCFDFIRPELIKRASDVGPWYINNILVFAKGEKASDLEKKVNSVINPIMFYHSEIFEYAVNNIIKQHNAKRDHEIFNTIKEYNDKRDSELFNAIKEYSDKRYNDIYNIIKNIYINFYKVPKPLVNILCCLIPSKRIRDSLRKKYARQNIFN